MNIILKVGGQFIGTDKVELTTLILNHSWNNLLS